MYEENRRGTAFRLRAAVAAAALTLVAGGCSSVGVGWIELSDPAQSQKEATASTQPSSVADYLTVDDPKVGSLINTGSILRGTTSSTTVAYRLLPAGGGTPLVEGIAAAVDGAFSAELHFANTCCVEMTLEVYQPGPDGLAVTIPVALPESS